jgi:hypothetical protein
MSAFLSTIAQIQSAGLDIDKNSKIEVLQPRITEAERGYILPVLGKPLYDALLADLEEDTPSAETVALLPYIQKPLAWMAYYLFYRKPIGSLSHTGFTKRDFQHGQTPAKWEIDSLKEELICTADRSLDELIAFLRENPTYYPLWEDSDYWSANKSLIIQSAEQFDQYVKIGCSARTFQRMLYYRQQAERNVPRAICGGLYARIVSELTGETELSDEIKFLLPFLRPMIAFDAMSKAVLQMTFWRHGSDVMSWTYADGTLTKNSLTFQEAKYISESYVKLYEDARNELLAFLKDNISDYPEYENSACYSTAPRTLVVKYPNDPLNKEFGI